KKTLKSNILDLFYNKSLNRMLCEAKTCFCASTKNGLNKSVHKFKTKFKIKTPATKIVVVKYKDQN
ncbi:hypothetical protein DD607_32605, partial [Salmonella sp. 3DZ2-4SM]